MPGASGPAAFMEKSLPRVSSIKGFVFPISNNSRAVEECGQCVWLVELRWEDLEFQYTGTVTALDAREVWDNLSRVHAEQLRQLDSLRSRENNHFTLPLTEQYIKDTFTDCAEQVRSGESVVLLNATHAYKRPLGTRATHRLLALERTRLVPFHWFHGCVLPSLSSNDIPPQLQFRRLDSTTVNTDS